MRTRPSFTNFPISLHASDLATSKTRSPFCSVQTLTAMSPLPIGMESFSLVPRVDQVTSFGARNLSKTLCFAAAERQIRQNAKSAICDFIVLITQPSHRKRLKTAENKGFLTFLNAMGRSVPLKTPIRFQIANKINGFVHVSYGTALEIFRNKKPVEVSASTG